MAWRKIQPTTFGTAMHSCYLINWNCQWQQTSCSISHERAHGSSAFNSYPNNTSSFTKHFTQLHQLGSAQQLPVFQTLYHHKPFFYTSSPSFSVTSMCILSFSSLLSSFLVVLQSCEHDDQLDFHTTNSPLIPWKWILFVIQSLDQKQLQNGQPPLSLHDYTGHCYSSVPCP